MLSSDRELGVKYLATIDTYHRVSSAQTHFLFLFDSTWSFMINYHQSKFYPLDQMFCTPIATRPRTASCLILRKLLILIAGENYSATSSTPHRDKSKATGKMAQQGWPTPPCKRRPLLITCGIRNMMLHI